MGDRILSTWQEIASFLKITVSSCKYLNRCFADFPVFRAGRVWTTEQALAGWVRKKAEEK